MNALRPRPALLAALLLGASHAHAATVQGTLVDVTRRPLSPKITFLPQSTPLADGSSTVLDVPRTTQADTNGFFSLELYGGRYNVEFGPYSKIVRILVPPNDTNTYAFNTVAQFATNVGTFSWTNAFQVGVAAGTNITITTNNAGLVTIHALAGPTNAVFYSTAEEGGVLNADFAPLEPYFPNGLNSGGNVSAANFVGNGRLLDSLHGTNLLAGTVNSNALDDATLALLGGGGPVDLPEILAPEPTGVAATDTANLQAAINATTNGIGGLQYGGRATVRLRGGQYALDNTLYIPMHMSLVGEGMERTRLQMIVNDKPALKIYGTYNSYGGTNNNWFSTYRGFSIRKTIAPWTSGTPAALDFVTGNDAGQQLSRAVIEDVLLSGWFYGIRVRHSVGVTYRRVEAYGCNHGFYIEKGDSQVFLNCFAGDALHSTYRTNLFGTNASTAWTFRSLPGLPGFVGLILGGEARRCNTALYANTGNLQVSGLNLEQMPDGPAFHLDTGALSGVFLNLNFNNQVSTNAAPLFKFAAGVGNNVLIGPGTMTSANAYPEVELAGATDTLTYVGSGPLDVTNTATATAYSLPLLYLRNGTNTLGPTVFTSSIIGHAGGLTNMNASSLASGTVPDARLSSNVVLSNATAVRIGHKAGQFAANSFNSTFLGQSSGQFATNTSHANFMGLAAGQNASGATRANMLGLNAGQCATNAQYANFLGEAAGQYANAASRANCFGLSAGQYATNAIMANYLGQYAGQYAPDGSFANFLGQAAGQYATNGSQANMLGYNTGQYTHNAVAENLIGAFAGQSATNASFANFIGFLAGQYASEASAANFVGRASGQYATNAARSIFIGPYSGTNRADTLWIDSKSTTADGSYMPLILGYFDLRRLTLTAAWLWIVKGRTRSGRRCSRAP